MARRARAGPGWQGLAHTIVASEVVGLTVVLHLGLQVQQGTLDLLLPCGLVKIGHVRQELPEPIEVLRLDVRLLFEERMLAAWYCTTT